MTPSPKGNFKVLVLQNGARHNYAVPLALAERGLLSGFYTDACGNQGLGRSANLLSKLPILGNPFKLLKNRTVPEVVLPLTYSFPVSTTVDRLFSGLNTRSLFLGVLMSSAGDKDSDLIYSSMGWSPWFLNRARKQGTKIVSEFYVRPSLWKTHLKEHNLFPEWEAKLPYARLAHKGGDPEGPCTYSDAIIAPTDAVKEDLIREGMFPKERIYTVPYGVHDSMFEISNIPEPGLVLYVGTCSISKGIHYLAMATQHSRVFSSGIAPKFVAAGAVSEQVGRQPICSSITFLGRVPRHKVKKLYKNADVLVFPTLSDGFGVVLLEAMAAGIPVICSPYCADVVEHGKSGYVVEPRDTYALAEAISSIINNRKLRDQMSLAAREKARQYTWNRHSIDLMKALSAIHATV